MNSSQTLLPAVSVLGVGAVTPLGRDLGEIARALGVPPADIGKTRAVKDELLAEPAIAKRMRRADRFARMAVIAAMDAWAQSQALCAGIPMERVGLIVASGFGPHNRGFKFIDGILDCGDSAALPTDFSHSVHGAASAYITEMLQLRGPALAMTDFEVGFDQAVIMAQCWLDQGVCDRVMVGAVEELGQVMLHCASRVWPGRERIMPGEGAVFLTLGPGDISGLARLDATALPRDVDLLYADRPVAGAAALPVVGARQTISSVPYFGQLASQSAMQVLCGILALSATANSERVDNVAIVRPLCGREAAMMLLSRG